MQITLTLNGATLTEDVRADMTLFDFCRAHGYKSVKCACETSNCGLCTVLLDGEPVLSCSVLMARVDGREVTTLEGMRDGRRELLAQCLAEEGAEQCGLLRAGSRDGRARARRRPRGRRRRDRAPLPLRQPLPLLRLREPDARDPPLPRPPRKRRRAAAARGAR